MPLIMHAMKGCYMAIEGKVNQELMIDFKAQLADHHSQAAAQSRQVIQIKKLSRLEVEK
ncbi:hypothetical protein N8I74_04995 [Chitiniphilus purpureus]|uniref:Uncharacterized protein n=1 Tax=Chitiniphilus purpureus TaxID=2981137 RepID=A0ABY6DPU5_9NEIS|nr:hypothetical protein [Chitiniphilus sp. CD1]UXY16380.1 hypothetical protein N8I74_04995 [Chitiniphilus sp. CD1]